MLDDLDQGTVQRILERTGRLDARHFPNMAALAARGAFGRKVYANAVSCCPSRTTFLTGTFSSQNKIWSSADGEYFEKDPGADPPPIGGGYREFLRRGHEASTIAGRLNPTYRTIAAGKYLNGYSLATIPPAEPARTCASGRHRLATPEGWNAWFGLVRGADSPSNGYSAYDANINGCVRSRISDDPTLFLRDSLRFAVKQIDVALGNQKPFFLYFSPNNVHSIRVDRSDQNDLWTDPERRAHFAGVRYYHRCGDDPRLDDADDSYDGTPDDCSDLYSFNEGHKPDGLADKPEWVGQAQYRKTFGRLDRTFRSRLASLEAFDEALGVLIDALGSRDILDETLIFLTSDQGFKTNEHGLRLGKNTPYEEDIQIPFIAAGPGIVPDPRFNALVSMVDLNATIQDAAGLTPTGSGLSFLDSLQGNAEGGRDYVLVEGVRGASTDVPAMGRPMVKFQVIRGLTQKFIWTRAIDADGEIVDGSDFYEVYDLIADPREMQARIPTSTEVALFTATIAACATGDCPPSLGPT